MYGPDTTARDGVAIPEIVPLFPQRFPFPYFSFGFTIREKAATTSTSTSVFFSLDDALLPFNLPPHPPNLLSLSSLSLSLSLAGLGHSAAEAPGISTSPSLVLGLSQRKRL